MKIEPKDSFLGFCSRCEKVLLNPCVHSDDFQFDGIPATREVAPSAIRVIRALPKKAYLTEVCACELGRFLARLNIPYREVRNYVAFRIYQGIEAGMRYEMPWGEELVFGPNTIDQLFDGRPDKMRSAMAEDWSVDIAPSDRAIADLMLRSLKGEIRSMPDKRWYLRFLAIRFAQLTPMVEVSDPD